VTTIWKYPFEVADRVTLRMPRGARVLSIQVQCGQPCLWVMVATNSASNRSQTLGDPRADLVEREFYVAGTGHPLPEKCGAYLGTFQLSGGALVFHVFEANP
jgi:hypothetical protein